jgi:hypothetical protein
MFDQVKGLFASKTFWTNAIGLLSFILSLMGFGELTSAESSQLVDTILQIITGVSFVLSTVFRVMATKKVTLMSEPVKPGEF